MKVPVVVVQWANPSSRRWRSERGGVGIREMIALMAVAVTILAATTAFLEVAGFDVAGWLQEQFGNPG
jgi:hypothetical protein